MKPHAIAIVGLLTLTGCASQDGKSSAVPSPAPSPQNVDWDAVDKSTARTKERLEKSGWKKTETQTVESGFLPMSDEDYATALADATTAVRRENPKWSDSEVEDKARERAEEAKRKFENSYTTRTTTSVKWTSP